MDTLRYQILPQIHPKFEMFVTPPEENYLNLPPENLFIKSRSANLKTVKYHSKNDAKSYENSMEPDFHKEMKENLHGNFRRKLSNEEPINLSKFPGAKVLNDDDLKKYKNMKESEKNLDIDSGSRNLEKVLKNLGSGMGNLVLSEFKQEKKCHKNNFVKQEQKTKIQLIEPRR